MSEITLDQLDQNNMPSHIAIIMDGNGRWAKRQGKIRTFGHRFGVDTVKNIITDCNDIGVKHLTLYAFSTENWKRPESEVSTLMNLVVDYLKKETPNLHRENVRMRFIGDLTRLPSKPCESVMHTQNTTKDNTGLTVNIALNYGGRSEIVMAAKRIAEDVKSGKLDEALLDEACFDSYLYTGGQPDPDLVIRTGGDIRISNFLLWQSAYSEFYFTQTLWPDFDKAKLYDAIHYFQNKERRFGGLGK